MTSISTQKWAGKSNTGKAQDNLRIDTHVGINQGPGEIGVRAT